MPKLVYAGPEREGLTLWLADEAETVAIGNKFAKAIADKKICIYLGGELGAGKTTLSRGIIQGFGHRGVVKSPTYTLVEPYERAEKNIYHFDLYRLASADELEFMGVQEYFLRPESLCLIEWFERGQGLLPAADLLLALSYVDRDTGDVHSRQNQVAAKGRHLLISAQTEQGVQVIDKVKQLVQL